MSNASEFEQLEGSEKRLESLFSELIELLTLEREALVAHDGLNLESCSAKKLLVCRQIDQQLKDSPELTQMIGLAATSDEVSSAQLDPHHILLAQLARTARDYNLVNGKILHRSQQSIREILGIMSGQSINGLYGQSGQQNAKPDTSSGGFIRA
jgi:flagellar biosynthesis/type III secretory pathway chaperone